MTFPILDESSESSKMMRESDKVVDQSRGKYHSERMTNMQMNAQLAELLKKPEAERSIDWEDRFLELLTQSDVYLLSDEPQTGPDNWPYMLVATEEVPGSQKESAQKLLSWLSERGIGLAVNPQKEYPDYVLSYGMVWGFRESGRFIDRRHEIPDGFVEYSRDSLKMSGPPTFEYLPSYSRKILLDFFRDQGILQPRFLMMSNDEEHYDFAVSVESLGKPSEEERVGIAEAISWFLPSHYSVLVISEKGLPKFEPLAMT